MAGEEIFDTFNTSGSTCIKFSSEMFKLQEIKQENLNGWDAAAWNIYYLEIYYL